MSNEVIIMVFLFLLVGYTWYALWNLQGKIKCQFHTKQRSVENRIISVKDKTVKFKNGTYEINPKRFSLTTVKILSIFPVPVLFQEWKWDTDQPIDPTTFKNSWDSPEARNAADSERQWRGFNEGVDSQLQGGSKKGGIEKWLPFITVGVVVIGLFFLYTTFNGKLGIIEQQIQSLGGMIKSLPK